MKLTIGETTQESKYEIFDTVYFHANGEIAKAKVIELGAISSDAGTDMISHYMVNHEGRTVAFRENQLFESPEALGAGLAADYHKKEAEFQAEIERRRAESNQQ